MKLHLYLGCLLLSVLVGDAADFDLGKRGTLSVTVPEDWKISGKSANDLDGKSIGYAFAIKPRGEANGKCLLTFAYVTNGVPNQDAIRKDVVRTCEPYAAESVEKRPS